MQQDFDINILRQDAQTRWLKASEVFFILKNHEKFAIANEAPKKPPSGSLFLFNKRTLRYFRNDGYPWRRKKDGKSVGEAHERLKSHGGVSKATPTFSVPRPKWTGQTALTLNSYSFNCGSNVDTLNCYYAHGEQNPFFQRRIYWMLDPAYEHIVFVHYRDVAEGRFTHPSLSNPSTGSSNSYQENVFSDSLVHGFTLRNSDLCGPHQSSSSLGSAEEVSSKYDADRHSSPQPEVNRALKKLVVQLSLDDDDDNFYFEENPPPFNSENENAENQAAILCEAQLLAEDPRGNHKGQWGNKDAYKVKNANGEDYSNIHYPRFPGYAEEQHNESHSGNNLEMKESISWKDMLELNSNDTRYGKPRTSGLLDLHGKVTFKTDGIGSAIFVKEKAENTNDLFPAPELEQASVAPYVTHARTHKTNGFQMSESDMHKRLSEASEFLLGPDSPPQLPTLMSQLPEIEQVSYYTPETSILEGNPDLAIDAPGTWLGRMQYENPLVTEASLTLAQKQQFSIREISPEWAFSYESTKVVIVGEFLCDPSEGSWAVMFGDIEVPVEIIQEGVIICWTPKHNPGRVTLCVTSSNRESCSQIREFEFRVDHNKSAALDASPDDVADKASEEGSLLARFTRLLLCGYDYPSTSRGDTEAELDVFTTLKPIDDQWEILVKALHRDGQTPSAAKDWILQELLKDKFAQWLLSKGSRSGGESLLSKQEQCIIHMISGLGYEWALSPVLSSGVVVNFRDANGWTALHWAAHFGREKMVAALLAAGASAGAVTKPTSQDPAGKTPAAIAALSGHKGLAGYLSEAALTSHLNSLTLKESEISKSSAVVEADKAVETISERTVQMHVGGTEDQLSLKDSLAAVRNAAQAAARIQGAFRAHSFRKRLQKTALIRDECGMTQDDIYELSNASKVCSSCTSRDQKLDKVVLSIQKKFRGWKGQREFLNLRKNVVKIQAHVRGHQVRKKYKEFVSTVSVLEKAILRWRHKGVGLRGYQREQDLTDDGNDEDDDIVRVFRKTKVTAALDEALSRVISMVDSPEARHQYRRMLECYREATVGITTGDEATTSKFHSDPELMKASDFDMF